MNKNGKGPQEAQQRNLISNDEMKCIFSKESSLLVRKRLLTYLVQAMKENRIKISDEEFEQINTFLDTDKIPEKFEELGVSLSFFNDNIYSLQIKEAMWILKRRLLELLRLFADFAIKYRHVPTIQYSKGFSYTDCSIGELAVKQIDNLKNALDSINLITAKIMLVSFCNNSKSHVQFSRLYGEDTIHTIDECICKDLHCIGVIGSIPFWFDTNLLNFLFEISGICHMIYRDISLNINKTSLNIVDSNVSCIDKVTLSLFSIKSLSARLNSSSRLALFEQENPHNRRVFIEKGLQSAGSLLDSCKDLISNLLNKGTRKFVASHIQSNTSDAVLDNSAQEVSMYIENFKPFLRKQENTSAHNHLDICP